MKGMTLRVLLFAEEGSWLAYTLEFSCHATGATFSEAKQNFELALVKHVNLELQCAAYAWATVATVKQALSMMGYDGVAYYSLTEYMSV
jgi:hypothetical protein